MTHRFATSFAGIPSILLPLSISRAQTVGDVLPPWTPRTLNIHQINTGKGDTARFIFPDGTTRLIDADALETDSRDG